MISNLSTMIDKTFICHSLSILMDDFNTTLIMDATHVFLTPGADDWMEVLMP